jgi:hypothetical protein
MKQEQWRQVQLKRLYEEMPDAFPAAAREPVGEAVDTQLERALARLRPEVKEDKANN